MNTTIPITATTCELVMPIMSRDSMSRLRYSFIPTSSSGDDYLIELHKYCSPLVNVEWNLLNGFENIYALHLLTIPFLNNSRINFINPPSITFTFPVLDTLEDRMELEELASTRHHCTLVPCSEFIVCPTIALIKPVSAFLKKLPRKVPKSYQDFLRCWRIPYQPRLCDHPIGYLTMDRIFPTNPLELYNSTTQKSPPNRP
jgi:hypothetical protein